MQCVNIYQVSARSLSKAKHYQVPICSENSTGHGMQETPTVGSNASTPEHATKSRNIKFEIWAEAGPLTVHNDVCICAWAHQLLNQTTFHFGSGDKLGCLL